MFGYIKPDIGELKVRQSGLYRAVYCGICKTGGAKVSRLTRFMLSYDFVFLAVLRLAATKERYRLESGRCVYNPLVKKTIMAKNDALVYTAAAFAVLSYYKLLDDINDGKGFKKLACVLLRPFFSRMRRRALRLYPALDGIVAIPLGELGASQAKNAPPDEAADCFARLMAGLLCFGLPERQERIAYSCGYHLGRYIYLLDACDDLDADIKSGNYNPLKSLYKNKQHLREDPSLIDTTLTDSMNAFLLSFNLLEPFDGDLSEIIENIIILGTKKTREEILSAKKVTADDRSI